jgi:hypothetical protein
MAADYPTFGVVLGDRCRRADATGKGWQARPRHCPAGAFSCAIRANVSIRNIPTDTASCLDGISLDERVRRLAVNSASEGQTHRSHG